MTDPSLREALLRHDRGTPAKAEIEVLHGLVAAEERRARRLIFGTIAVWGLWTAMTVGLVAIASVVVLQLTHATVQMAGKLTSSAARGWR